MTLADLESAQMDLVRVHTLDHFSQVLLTCDNTAIGGCANSEGDCCELVGSSDTSYRNFFCCQAANQVFLRVWSNARTIFSSASLASFTSIGLAVGDRIKPDVVAPGDIVISANSNCDLGMNCGTGKELLTYTPKRKKELMLTALTPTR